MTPFIIRIPLVIITLGLAVIWHIGMREQKKTLKRYPEDMPR